MSKAYINFVLHNHMPFVREPDAPSISEERWFFENLTNCQIPLLKMLSRLEKDRVPTFLTLSFSGTMLSMLSDDLLKKHFEAYLNQLIELGAKEVARTSQAGLEQEKFLAEESGKFYEETLSYFKEIKGDLVSQYCHFADKGMVELIASTLTHAFLPNYQFSPFAVDLQVKLGIALFKSTFERDPTGFWLPECGYYPGLEKALKKRGIHYFFLDSHGILLSEGETPYGPYAPITVSGVNALAQDPYLQQFFSTAGNAYPNQTGNRDYFSDIGFDLPMEEIRDYLCGKGKRINTGYKYYGQSSTGEKLLYSPEKARAQTEANAKEFLSHIEDHNAKIAKPMKKREALFNVLCEADLFGHWWLEGVHFLESFYRGLIGNEQIQATTGSRYLLKYADNPKIVPAYSSWGKNGFSEPWLNHENDWICRLNHDMVEKLEDLVTRYADTSSFQQNKMVLQAIREVLLAQSSDWPFMIWEGHHTAYASGRVQEHHDHFQKICNYLINNKYDVLSFIQMEKKYNLMPKFSLQDVLRDVTRTQ